MKTHGTRIRLAALALLLPPCLVSADDVVSADEVVSLDDAPPAVGSLTLQWTLNGRREPIDCNGLGAERLEFTLNPSVLHEDDWNAPCDAFELSIDVPPGSYTGEAALIDRLDRPVTVSVTVDQIDIVAGRNLVKAVDFPVAGFLSLSSPGSPAEPLSR